MEEQVRLELFTVRQVRDWLEHGVTDRGLSEKIISRTRAWSIIHNPYATDDLNIISVIFVNDEVAAYTHLFPDEQGGQRIYWNTTLYCAPQYEGRGYAAIVIGQFCELYGEHYFDLDAAEASVANLKFCGLTIDYVPQYILSRKAIRGNMVKAMLARFKERLTYAFSNREKELQSDIKKASYTIRYTRFVDDKVYEFIRAHSGNNVFLRSKAMFNWILQYPLMLDCPLLDHVERDSEFTSNKQGARIYGVEVYIGSILVGFYILNISAKGTDVSYLYYELEHMHDVFLSIAEHILLFKTCYVFMADERLCEFLQYYKLYPKSCKRMKSFSYPHGFAYDTSKTFQSGDGDNLT